MELKRALSRLIHHLLHLLIYLSRVNREALGMLARLLH